MCVCGQSLLSVLFDRQDLQDAVKILETTIFSEA